MKLRFITHDHLVRIGLPVLFAVCSLFFVMRNDHRHQTTLSIDIAFYNNDLWEVFYDLGKGYVYSALAPTAIETTTFSDVTRLTYLLPAKSILRLRIDPGSKPGPVSIKSISLKNRRQELCWQAQDIMRDFFPLNHIEGFAALEGLVSFLVTGNDPFFHCSNPLYEKFDTLVRGDKYRPAGIIALTALLLYAFLPHLTRIWWHLVGRFGHSMGRYKRLVIVLVAACAGMFADNFSAYSIIMAGAFLFLLISVWYTPGCTLYLGLTGLGVLIAGQCAALVLNGTAPLPSISQALGNAAFIGCSKALEQRSLATALAISLGWAVITAVVARRFLAKRCDAGAVVPALQCSVPFIAVLAGIFMLCGFPPIKTAFDSLATATHTPDWDSLNNIMWGYALFKGLLPFRDYWYPYGGFYNMMSPLPWDMFRLYVHNCILFAGFLTALYVLLGTSKWWTIASLAAFILLKENGYMPGAFRYCMSLNAVLLFLALQRIKGASALHYALYGLFVGWVALHEVPQLLYAGVPLAVASLMAFATASQRAVRMRLARHLAVAALCCLVLFSCYLALLACRGQLAGFVEFNRLLQAQASGSMIPANLASWFAFAPFDESFVLYSPLWFIATGIFLAMLPKGHRGRQCSDIMLSLGILGFFIFEKHMIRPHMAKQFLYIFILGDILLLYHMSLGWKSLQKEAFLALAVFACATALPSWRNIAASYAARAARITGDGAVLLKNEEAMAKSVAAYYAPKAFLAYPGAEEFLAYHQAIPESERSDFYVLGDNGYFYILAQQTPPYFFTFYNGCSIFDQKRIIAWLERKNIRRIIYNSTVHSFDNVPNLARVPILFEHVVKNYAPARQFASFCVLEKKALPPAETLAFWLSRLGHELDLGHIPSNTSFALMSDCTGLKPPACFDLLEIKTPPASQARKRSIYLRYGMYSLAISFQQNDRDTHYLVPLDRIWFWSVLKEAGLKHFLTIDYESDMHARLIQKKAPVDILY